MSDFVNLHRGDPAPWFHQRNPDNPNYAVDSAAGRYLVFCFFGSAADETARKAITSVMTRPDLFDDRKCSFFGVSTDPADETQRRVTERYPGYRYFWDFDLTISRLYGAAPRTMSAHTETSDYRRFWLVLDPLMRVVTTIPLNPDGSDRTTLLDLLTTLPSPDLYVGSQTPAPVLLLPNVFEPELCRHLINLYDQDGGEDSGFMREEAGLTVRALDHDHKQRRDTEISDARLISMLKQRVIRRIVPEIQKVFQFKVTRMERYLVACYSEEHGGHFRPHRDNTTKGTAHRRFALSVNLNDDYDGAELGFPEFGSRTYKTSAGGAVVFSCSLLHTVVPITRGRRYVFLPFLYDDAAAKIREENNRFLSRGIEAYASTTPESAQE